MNTEISTIIHKILLENLDYTSVKWYYIILDPRIGHNYPPSNKQDQKTAGFPKQGAYSCQGSHKLEHMFTVSKSGKNEPGCKFQMYPSKLTNQIE